MSLRVLHVLNYYSPHISGLTEYARLLAESQSRSGYSVTVLTGCHHPSLAREELLNGVRVIRAKPLVKLHKGFVSPDFVRLYRALVYRHDIAHLHLPMLESGVLAFLTPQAIPLVATYQCDMAESRKSSIVDRIAVRTVRASCRACCKRASKVLVTSMDYARGSPVVRDLTHKLKEVYPPDNAPEPASLRPVRNGHKTVGFLGRFVEEKGINVLLDAIPSVLERVPKTRFVLAGDYESVPGGSEMDRLREKIQRLQPHVETPGKLPDETLFRFYRSLDVFVLPSVNAYEAFGIVQIEAMKAGVPVVASDLRGVRVPVQLTGNGALAAAGNARELADAIVRCLTTEDAQLKPEQIASRAWRCFPAGGAAARVEEVYGELLNFPEKPQRSVSGSAPAK